jgi:hypothetical protein
MTGTRYLLAQVAAEYGVLIARDALAVVRNLVSTSGTEIVLICLGILAVLYILTRLM